MPNRALSEKRPILLASMAAALAFFFMRQSPLPELFLVPLKGAAVGLLALYAFMRHRGRDAYHLGAIMIVAALGDMAMEVDHHCRGAALLPATTWCHRALPAHPREHCRSDPEGRCRGNAAAHAGYLLAASRSTAPRRCPLALYGLAVGGMAACAWLSAFPRYRVGLGAVLFLASDVLIVAGYGPLMGQHVAAAG